MNSSVLSTPNDSGSKSVPLDAKFIWVVPYMAGVDHRGSLSLLEHAWDERSDMGASCISESHCRHDLAQRSGEYSSGPAFPQTVLQGRHFMSQTPQNPVSPQ